MAARCAAAMISLAILGHTARADEQADMCGGGSEEACSCLLSCPVFGSEEGAELQCHNSANDLLEIVDEHVRKALQIPGQECDGITCVVECAKMLGCLDARVEGRCLNVVRDRPECEVECSDATTAAGGSPLAAAAVALAAAAAIC